PLIRGEEEVNSRLGGAKRNPTPGIDPPRPPNLRGEEEGLETQPTNYATASGISPSAASNLVYAIGTVGYDFGTEARRDSFKQLMPSVEINGTRVPANPYDARQMADYLDANLYEASSLIWTFNLEQTPIYALKPAGAFGADIYETLQNILAGEAEAEDSEDYIERVSISGRLTGETVRLFSGQTVPVVKAGSPRGMYGWTVNSLVENAIASLVEEDATREEAVRKSLKNFLSRVYYDLRNLGQTDRDRALNFAATNVFQATATISEAVAVGMELHGIEVEKSPFCRYNSNCWDVKLKFFDPDNIHRAKKVYRFTIDVIDLLPVTLGKVRSWSVPK
ncbi:MAG: PatA/PatG family cyanobactin maturation protease, partial [Cyanobacteriota bacterium]|nr:PatA/PatG family cyanobactin maturation protease [Cyanobacteriota bacterium]